MRARKHPKVFSGSFERKELKSSKRTAAFTGDTTASSTCMVIPDVASVIPDVAFADDGKTVNWLTCPDTTRYDDPLGLTVLFAAKGLSGLPSGLSVRVKGLSDRGSETKMQGILMILYS